MTEFLSPNAEKIMKLKYSQEKPNGEKEEWNEIVTRVAQYVASAEENEPTELAVMAQFIQIMYQRDFLPGGRILANAGTGIKNLFNCFVLGIDDSRESIYKALGDAAEIFAWGGGLGYNFSNLREKGALVSTTGGQASGPLSFMRLFNQTGEVISQASRRGAQMGIINIDHPDVLHFINFKNELNEQNSRVISEFKRNIKALGHSISDRNIEILIKTLSDDQLTHFNISVGISDDFMESVLHETGNWEFKSRDKTKDLEDSGSTALEILGEIAVNAWKNGDPGLFFLDRANETSLVRDYMRPIEATNPCGEIPLLDGEACCLGSLNLANFVEGDKVDWYYLESVIRVAVRFLDNVHTLNTTPVDHINEATRKTRRLGLGVMGFSDMLAELGIPYGSEESVEFASDLAYFIGKAAWKASMDLAEERGPFPAYEEDKINWKMIDRFGLEHRPVRNVAVTGIAPTGTISLIADVNSGIEPFFAVRYKRNITEGIGNEAKDTIMQDIPLLKEAKDEWGWDDDKINEVFVTAHDIPWNQHVKMQATWQEFTDNAISKTINMNNDTTVGDVMSAYLYAWNMGCKGITVYRDGSKYFQILER